jgi:tRNA G18 (ribose-2'-O)-methylase SpoU
MLILLNNIRSSENVGSIFRTSDAFGVKKIYLVGYTPAPLDRFGRKNGKLIKSSLGAENFVEWETVNNLESVIKELKKDNFKIIGVEQMENSINYQNLKAVSSKSNFAFVFGNEVDGLSEEDLKLCDQIVEIPMRGKLKRELKEDLKHKESLNVAVAVGIILSNFSN